VKSWDTLAMIQCVGSRTPDNPNCSRICCQSAIKNALRVLDLNPEMQVFIFTGTCAPMDFLRITMPARRRGVIFVRYEADTPPQVTAAGDQVAVAFSDPILGRELVKSPPIAWP
jgi:heterodisulfide reductase subunit A